MVLFRRAVFRKDLNKDKILQSYVLFCMYGLLCSFRWFRGRVDCVLDLKAGDPGSIPIAAGILTG